MRNGSQPLWLTFNTQYKRLVFRRLFNILLRYLREREKEHHGEGEEAPPKGKTRENDFEIQFSRRFRSLFARAGGFNRTGGIRRGSRRGGDLPPQHRKFSPRKFQDISSGEFRIHTCTGNRISRSIRHLSNRKHSLYEDLLSDRPKSTLQWFKIATFLVILLRMRWIHKAVSNEETSYI